MKDNANDLSGTRQSGVVRLFEEFQRLSKVRSFPKIRLHLIGHSAGAIVQSFLAPRADALGFDVATLSLLVPALLVDDFNDRLSKTLATRLRILVAHLIDSAERADPTCRPYGQSLLYLVSRAFEGEGEAGVLGMEKHLVPALAAHKWGAQVSRLSSPGGSYHADDPLTTATTHGGLDDDLSVQDAVIRHIKGPGFSGRVVRDRRLQRS